jgi:hypothetical protein
MDRHVFNFLQHEVDELLCHAVHLLFVLVQIRCTYIYGILTKNIGI